MDATFPKSHRARVPSGRAKIDWTHPLANGLIGCWVWGTSGGINLTGASPDLTRSSPVTDGVGADGPALGFTAAPSTMLALAPPAFKSWTEMSMFGRLRTHPSNLPNDYPMVIGVTYDNANGAPYATACIMRRPSNPNYMAFTNSAGSIASTGEWAGTPGNTDNIGANFKVGGNIDLYANGTLVLQSTLPSAPNTTATAQLGCGIGVVNTGSGVLNATALYVGYIWNRVLSADEHMALHLDPYCFLIYPEDEVFVALAGPPPSGGSVGTASGVGTATAVGTGIAAATGTVAGVGAATGVGQATTVAIAAAAGSGVATAVGVAAIAATGAAAGVGVALGVGAATMLLRPDADITAGGWLNEVGGVTLFSSIDEVVAGDADYIVSGSSPVNDSCEIRLSDPGSLAAQPAKVRYRYWRTGAAGSMELRVRLLQGATQITSWTHSAITSTHTTTEQTLSTPEFAAITNFNDLRLEFRANKT